MEILGINLSVKNVDEKLLRGIEMSNFIENLDCLYDDVRVKNKISPYNKNFALYIPIKVLLLKYYYYMDERAKAYLENVGFDVEGDIYSNYDTQEKRDAKIKIFCDFDSFEKAGIIW